ncbi:MAG: PcfJ domain-containing protein [Sphingomonas sp.]
MIAVLACGKFSSHITYGELDQFRERLALGPRLKDLLASYGTSRPMAKLSATALRLGDRAALEALGRLDASSLSQAIPSDSQRVWLDGIDKWLRLTPRDKAARKHFNVGWIARHLGADLSRFEQVDALIDFLGKGGGQLNERWGWDSAMRAVEDWHRRLRDDRALVALVRARDAQKAFDTVICKSPLPDAASLDGFDFVVLRTARDLRNEGVALHHCVASYARSVKAGDCAVVSVRKDGVNIATLEIDRAGQAVQIKGHCNAKPLHTVQTACEMYALRFWKPAEAAKS